MQANKQTHRETDIHRHAILNTSPTHRTESEVINSFGPSDCWACTG